MEGPLTTLADEILLMILKHLPLWDLYTCAFVSTTLRRLVCDSSINMKESLLKAALEEVDKQNYDKALVILDKARVLFPFWSELWKERGLCLKDKNYLRRATRALYIAQQLSDSEDVKLLIGAQLQWIQNRYSDSYALIDLACKLNPTNPRFFHFRAFIQSCISADGDPEGLVKELEDYKTVLRLHEKNPYSRISIVYNNIGYVEYISENFEKALEFYNASIEANPNHVRAYYNRSLVWQDMGLFDIAISDIDKILKINPNLVEVYALRGSNLVSMGEYEKAAEDYRKSLKRSFTFDHTVNPYLALCVCIGDFDNAINDSNWLIEENTKAKQSYEDWVARTKERNNQDEQQELLKLQEILRTQSEVPSDYVDDCEYSDKIKSINRTLIELYRIRGEMLFLDGKFRESKKDFDELHSKPNLSPKRYPFLHFLFTSSVAPQISNISPSTIDFVRECNRTHKSRSHRTFSYLLKTSEKFCNIKFKNIDESLFFVCSYVYKFFALYLVNMVCPVAILTRFCEHLRKIDMNSVEGQAVLCPYIVHVLIKMYRVSDEKATPKLVLDGYTGKVKMPVRDFLLDVAAYIEKKAVSLGIDSDPDIIVPGYNSGEDSEHQDDGSISDSDSFGVVAYHTASAPDTISMISDDDDDDSTAQTDKSGDESELLYDAENDSDGAIDLSI